MEDIEEIRMQQISDWIKKNRLYIDLTTRILMIGLAVIIFAYLIKNIEAIKFLAYDPCKICMEKTGSICTYVSLNP